MSDVSFSLTEVIINPVLGLRAEPLDTLEYPLTIPEKIRHFFQSEVVTRIIALATSFFAAIDFMVHLGSGIVKGAHLGLRKLGIRGLCPAPSSEEIAHHFKQSAKFLGITAIGSVAATVWPGVFKYFRVSTGGDWKNISETVASLWVQISNKRAFEKLWKNASIHDKRIIVGCLDKDNSSKGSKAKSELVDIVYRKISRHSSDQWPKQTDVPVFYHATSLQGLEGILKSRKIEVRHEKAYNGAFVSTPRPETLFGKYILVFNRSIERLSYLNHGFEVKEGVYWAGFSHEIPVNETTLIGILVHNGEYGEASTLAGRCKDWTGREIKVKNLSLHGQISGDKDIPKEWPGSDPNAAAIQWTMTIRVRQRQEALKVKHDAVSVSATPDRHRGEQRQMALA